MPTQTLIYLASISSSVRFFCIMVGICLFAPIIGVLILQLKSFLIIRLIRLAIIQNRRLIGLIVLKNLIISLLIIFQI